MALMLLPKVSSALTTRLMDHLHYLVVYFEGYELLLESITQSSPSSTPGQCWSNLVFQ